MTCRLYINILSQRMQRSSSVPSFSARWLIFAIIRKSILLGREASRAPPNTWVIKTIINDLYRRRGSLLLFRIRLVYNITRRKSYKAERYYGLYTSFYRTSSRVCLWMRGTLYGYPTARRMPASISVINPRYTITLVLITFECTFITVSNTS